MLYNLKEVQLIIWKRVAVRPPLPDIFTKQKQVQQVLYDKTNVSYTISNGVYMFVTLPDNRTLTPFFLLAFFRVVQFCSLVLIYT